MAGSIDSKLLNEICTIKSKENYMAGKILKIYEDKFAVKLTDNVELADDVEILIETLDNVIYFYVAKTESQHVLDDERIIMFQPISDLNENNKRSFPRFKTDIYFHSKVVTPLRLFPPKDMQWLHGELIDISEGGIKTSTTRHIPQNELIEVKIGEPFFEKTKFVICRVEHVQATEESGYHISCEFINVTPEERRHIRSFIEYASSYVKDQLTI